jgi:HmuY protein
LLEPDPVTFVLRTADGRYAKLRVLSYYCPGPEPGCLTIEYSFQGNGSRRLEAASSRRN